MHYFKFRENVPPYFQDSLDLSTLPILVRAWKSEHSP